MPETALARTFPALSLLLALIAAPPEFLAQIFLHPKRRPELDSNSFSKSKRCPSNLATILGSEGAAKNPLNHHQVFALPRFEIPELVFRHSPSPQPDNYD
jgi:hypothetical protein